MGDAWDSLALYGDVCLDVREWEPVTAAKEPHSTVGLKD